jgi:Phage tail lysozyme
VLGINTDGKDPAQLMGQVALAARARFLADHQNMALASAQGLTDLFAPADLVRMAKQRPGDIEQSYAQANRDMAPGGRLFLSDEVGRKWQDFLATLGTAGTALQDKLIDKLTVLEKPLEGVAEKFGDLLLDVLKPANLKAVGDGIEEFGHYLDSPKFKADFKTFVDDTSYAAGKMVDVLRMLGLIPESQQQKTKDNAKELALEQAKWDASNIADIVQFGPWLGPKMTRAMFGPRPTDASLAAQDPVYAANAGRGKTLEPGPWSAPTGPVGALSSAQQYTTAGMRQRDQAALKYYMSQGWSADAAAGIVGYTDAEGYDSPNPAGPNDHGQAFGAGQWHSGWQAEFKKEFGHDIHQSTLQEQWAFMSYTLKHQAKAIGDRIRTMGAYDAGGTIARDYGRGSNPAADYVSHGRAAVAARQLVIGVNVTSATGTDVAATVNAMQ